MNATHVYAAYLAPLILVLIGAAMRAWSAHRIAHAKAARAGKVGI